MILLKLMVPFAIALSVSACVLSSKASKFGAESSAFPIAADTAFAGYTKDGSEWKEEEETFSFKRDGKSYLMSDGKNTASVIFVQLKPEWFAGEYRENDGPSY